MSITLHCTPRELLTALLALHASADLRRCHTEALTSPMRIPRPSAQRPWSYERLSERDLANLVTAYRDGAAAASLATAHGVSLKASNAYYTHRRYPPRNLTHSTRYESNAGGDASVAASAQAFTRAHSGSRRRCL
jgi:hypothetical protein